MFRSPSGNNSLLLSVQVTFRDILQFIHSSAFIRSHSISVCIVSFRLIYLFLCVWLLGVHSVSACLTALAAIGICWVPETGVRMVVRDGVGTNNQPWSSGRASRPLSLQAISPAHKPCGSRGGGYHFVLLVFIHF